MNVSDIIRTLDDYHRLVIRKRFVLDGDVHEVYVGRFIVMERHKHYIPELPDAITRVLLPEGLGTVSCDYFIHSEVLTLRAGGPGVVTVVIE